MFDLVCNEHRYTPKKGDKVLDLGAYFGFFSLFCACHGANVVAYEPDPDNYDRLLDATGRAREIGFGTIFPVKEAVWLYDGILSLYREHHSGTSNVVANGELRTQVKTASLHHALNEQKWDCVKMDIEGAEFPVLQNASDEDLKKIKYLSLELHNHISNDPQPRYENLIAKLEPIFNLDLVEKRDGRFCKVFATLK